MTEDLDPNIWRLNLDAIRFSDEEPVHPITRFVDHTIGNFSMLSKERRVMTATIDKEKGVNEIETHQVGDPLNTPFTARTVDVLFNPTEGTMADSSFDSMSSDMLSYFNNRRTDILRFLEKSGAPVFDDRPASYDFFTDGSVFVFVNFPSGSKELLDEQERYKTFEKAKELRGHRTCGGCIGLANFYRAYSEPTSVFRIIGEWLYEYDNFTSIDLHVKKQFRHNEYIKSAHRLGQLEAEIWHKRFEPATAKKMVHDDMLRENARSATEKSATPSRLAKQKIERIAESSIGEWVAHDRQSQARFLRGKAREYDRGANTPLFQGRKRDLLDLKWFRQRLTEWQGDGKIKKWCGKSKS